VRILQVATLTSRSGTYGGPVTVARNQTHALRQRGHHVVMASGVLKPEPTITTGGHMAFRAHWPVTRLGFAGLTSPKMVWHFRHAVRNFDVVHVHLARDLITLPMARLALLRGVPVVLQTHGMIDPSDRRLAAAVDHLLTLPVLRGSKTVLFLTDDERSGLLRVSPQLQERLHQLPNGVPPTFPILKDQPPEVVFLARLHAVKRPDLFLEAARHLALKYPDWTFTLAGPDGGELDAVKRLISEIASPRVRYQGTVSPDRVASRLAAAQIYVLPTDGDVFPMSVLESLAGGTPVVTTAACGLAKEIHTSQAGLVVPPGSATHIREAIETLIKNPEKRRRMGSNGRELVTRSFSIDQVCAQLEDLYGEAVTAPGGV
jgi:glycosyltransferase involved in cell wall biosynthesis